MKGYLDGYGTRTVSILVPGPQGPLAGECGDVEDVNPDGDTLDIRLIGQLGTVPVRGCGFNAEELTDRGPVPTGDGVEAALEVRRIVAVNRHVHLSSRLPGSMSGDRIKRYIQVQLPESGEWVDLGLHLIRLGLARPLAQRDEYDRNLQYAQAARVAARAGLGMWSPIRRGPGPVGAFRLTVNWDQAKGGGEYVDVTNTHTGPVDLAGWRLIDGMTRTEFRFPPGSVTRRGETRRVYVKAGAGSGLTHYWGAADAIFDNPTGAPLWMNDGAYLYDPLGNIRAWLLYPDLTRAPLE